MPGTLALVGGAAWRDGCEFDRDLLDASGGNEVAVIAAAAAYEHPERHVEAAGRWFESLEARVRDLGVLARPHALDEAVAAAVRAARFVYLADGSPMHLRSVLKDTPVWDALVGAWNDGAVVAGAGAGAMVLCDPMVDPRGGALTLGLGLVEQLAVIPHHDTWSEDRARRTLQIAPRSMPLVGVDERAAAIRGADGTWTAAGAGRVVVYVDGDERELTVLP
jgi:cyanophycinase